MRAVLGSAYGIAKAGIGIASVGVMKPDFVMKALVPVIFAAAIAAGAADAGALLQRFRTQKCLMHKWRKAGSFARGKLGGGMWIFTPSYALWNRTMELINESSSAVSLTNLAA